jgi:hypothetical protein
MWRFATTQSGQTTSRASPEDEEAFVICDFGDVVVVPFPLVDLAAEKRRPSLILSHSTFNDTHGHSDLRDDHDSNSVKMAGRRCNRRFAACRS